MARGLVCPSCAGLSVGTLGCFSGASPASEGSSCAQSQLHHGNVITAGARDPLSLPAAFLAGVGPGRQERTPLPFSPG